MQAVTSHWLFQNSGSASAHLGCTSHFSWVPPLGRREGNGVWQSWAAWPLAKSSVRGELYNLAWGCSQRESWEGGKGCAWSEGEERPHHQVGTRSCSSYTPWLVVAFFLVHWLLWEYAYISTNALFLFFLHPIASKIHYSNSFSVRSSQQWELYFSYFPSVTVKMQTKPLHPDYTLEIAVLSLLSNSLDFLYWVLINNDINSPYSYFTIKMTWFLSEDKTM